MSDEQGLNTQLAGEEFTDKLMAAFDSGNQAEIDRVMRESEDKELVFKGAPEPEPDLPKPEIPAEDNQAVESEAISDNKTEVPDAKPAEKPAEAKDDSDKADREELKKLIEIERRRAEMFEHRARSDAGRVSALQQRINELTSKLETAKPQEDSPPAAKNTQVEQLNQKIARLKEVDPELADILADMSTGLGTTQKLTNEEKQRLEQLEKYVSEFEEQREQEALQSEWKALVAEYPAAPDALRSSEWQAWKAAQTPYMRQMAESGLHRDVGLALQKFAADMAVVYGLDLEAPAPAAKEAPSVSATEADRIKEERDRKLRTSTPASARTPAETVAEPDAEKLFELAFNKTLKDRNLI